MTEREAIAYDLIAIMTEVYTSDLPDSARGPWLRECIHGYVQTDLGVPHPSGVDASGWRGQARERGLDVSDANHLCGARRRRDAHQAATVATHSMLATMRGES